MRGKTLLLIMNAERRLQTDERLIILDESVWIAENITQ